MSKYTKIFLTFLIALVSAHSAEVLNSDKNSLTVKFKPEFKGFREITLSDGNTYSMPNIKDAFIKEGAIGEPAEYILKEIITVPFKGAYNLSNVTPLGIRKFDKLIVPNANKYIEDLQQSMQANLSLYTAYNPDSKNNWANVRDLGIARTKFIAEINVTVAYFNKNTQQIEIPEEIIVSIDFKDNNFFFDSPISSSNDNSIPTLNNIPDWNMRGISSNQLEYSLNIVEKDLANKSATNFAYPKLDKSNSIQADTYDNQWAKIEIPSEGIYKITAADLSKYGFSLNKEDIPSIKIYGNNGKDMNDSPAMASKNFLNDVPVIVNTNADGSLESIVFYATGPNGFEYSTGPFDGYIKSYRHFINHYSKNNYYMLAWGGSKSGKRLVEAETPTGAIVNKPTQYINRVFQEEEFVNPYTAGSGRQFLGRSYFSNLIKQNLDGLAANDTVWYRISATHRSKTATGNFNFFDNEKKIGGTLSAGTTGDYGAGERGEIFASVPFTNSNSTESSIRIDYKSSNTSATGFLDFIEWHWKRPFSAINGAISFFADTTLSGLTEYNMTGFGSNKYAFDVSNPTSPVLLKNISSNPNEVKFVVNLVAKTQQQFFVSSDIKSPTLFKADFAALRTVGEGFDVLLVTDKSLVPSAEKYKAYRESNSELKVKIVTTDQIYTEFSSGVPQVGAIRDYVAFTLLNPALDNKTPNYLILWGDGHFDFRNIQSAVKNMVPPFESLDDRTRFDEISSSCIDDFYARVIGNDNISDISLGRVTINSNEEGELIIEKLRNYETGASKDQWRTRVTIVADDGLKTNSSYNEGDLFTGQAENLSENHIGKGFIQKKIYLADYVTEVLTAGRKKPTVNLDIVSTVNNQGTSVLYWIGHGNPTVWAHEGIFTKGTVPEMVNKDKLFILSAATCDFARFDMGENTSGAEDLYISKYGGAICVFAATRVVYAGENAMINNAFTSLMFKQDSLTGLYQRFGDIMKQLKATFNGTNDEKYFLIGDPTMRPNFPNFAVKIDTINGKSTSEGTILLKGLDKVSISGRIANYNSNNTISDFNGSVTLALYDGVNHIKVFDEDGKKYEFNKLGGALTNSSFEVKNGTFKAEFYIPKDISYSDTNATIYSFAASNDNRFAKGITSTLKLDGVNSVQSTDSKPNIKLYMEARDFKECGTVRQNPLLIADVSDEYGINSTGIGIGHKLEAWIDDNPQSIDLTEYYYPSLTDSKSGSIIRALPSLAAGEHRARVRVWNLFNKFNMAEICFVVKPDTSGIEISNITNYPNPAETNTIIKFNHNLEPPFSVELNILNSVGGVVKTINKDITTSFSVEIPWDCTDDSNNKISSGVYPYSIVLKSKSGKTATGYGISTVIK